MKNIEELKLSIYESVLSDDIKYSLINIIESSSNSDFNQEYQKVKNQYDEVFDKLEELDKAYNYKEAISLLTSVIKSAESLLNKVSENNSDISRSLKSMIKSCESKIKKFKSKNIKKKLNNKYYIDYTKRHNEAFRETEKEILGYNTKAGKNHDMDKYIMYHFLPAPIAQTLHNQFSKHHKKRARSKEDYLQMIIDIECGRKTKPDKQMKPYQVIDKFYPELKSTMIPILKEYGLPTNEKEDREMEAKKKKK